MNRTTSGIVLSEFVLSGDPLYSILGMNVMPLSLKNMLLVHMIGLLSQSFYEVKGLNFG